jgi:hypothetical protein
MAQHLGPRAPRRQPRRLAPDARDSVCEQCHLQGDARILNPSKDWDDFVPGEVLENTFTVFIGDSGDNTPLASASRSSCGAVYVGKRAATGRGGTCHDPHSEPANKAAYYREKCPGCHGATLARITNSTSDCVGCHMPSRGTIDGAHAAFTDHQIRRRPVKEELGRQPSSLVPWRAGPREYAQRNLGLAYLSAGAQWQSPELLGKAFPLIAEARQAFPRDSELTAGARPLCSLEGHVPKAARYSIWPRGTRDLTPYHAAP